MCVDCKETWKGWKECWTVLCSDLSLSVKLLTLLFFIICKFFSQLSHSIIFSSVTCLCF